MAEKLIVVVGVTGRQGSSVAKTFLAEGSWKVRGITRDVDSSTAKALQAEGVEIVPGNLDSQDSLVKAFEGATLIFGLTDFWSNLKDPALHAKATEEVNVFDLSAELEVKHGINIVEAAAKIKGLERFIFASLPDPHNFDATKTKFENLRHVFPKRDITNYLAANQPKLAEITSELHLSYFFENWDQKFPTSPAKGEDGKLHVYYPFPGTTKFYHSAASLDTGPGVLALYSAKPNTKLFLGSEKLTWNEYLETFSAAVGISNGGVVNVGHEGFVGLIPGPLGPELYENFFLIEELSIVDLRSEGFVFAEDLGVKTTTWKEYLAKTDLSSIKG